MKYDGSIEGLFSILENVCSGVDLPSHIDKISERELPNKDSPEADLFNDPVSVKTAAKNLMSETLSGIAGELYEVSAAGYSNFVYAWLSEFPIEAEIIRFGFLLIQAARKTDKRLSRGTVSCKGREAAEHARNNRMEAAVKIVRDASFKTGHEAHRLMGLLRFSPGNTGVLTAYCSPDHFVLPILAEHFTLRFGNSPWAIVDEKRRMVLIKNTGIEAELDVYNPHHPWFEKTHKTEKDEWENLWLSYFKAINNESRVNPKVQLQFMPKRYWKYLPEMREGG